MTGNRLLRYTVGASSVQDADAGRVARSVSADAPYLSRWVSSAPTKTQHGGFMKLTGRARRWLSGAAVLALTAGVLAATTEASSARDHHGGHGLAVNQVNLVSDLPGMTLSPPDPDLVNPWGLALGPETPLWSANNGTDTATLYSSPPGSMTATKLDAVRVTLPGSPSLPTGQVFNGTDGFMLSNGTTTSPARFIFSSIRGQILAWSNAVDPLKGDAEVKVPASNGNVYTGLAIAKAMAGPQLYASNFAQGRIDVFDSSFKPVRLAPWQFRDRALPQGFSPFGVQTLGKNVFVAYAKVDPATGRNAVGEGLGAVDKYSADGRLIARVATGRTLNAPWGLAIAPSSWGRIAGDLLVGNFGDGKVNVIEADHHHHHHHGYYDHDDHGRRDTGEFEGLLRDAATGQTLAIPGLWSLLPGTATTGGTDSVWFSAGIEDEQHGLIGVLRRPSE